MRTSCVAIVLAGLTGGGVAWAQESEPLPFGGEIVLGAQQVVAADPPVRGGYQSRAVGLVYDNFSAVFGNGTGGNFLAQTNQVLEDVSFVGGPWALPYTSPRVITSVTIGTAVLTTPTSTTTDRLFVVIWDRAEVNFNGFTGNLSNMIHSGVAPLGFVIVDPGTNAAGFIYQFTLNGLNIAVPPTANAVCVQAGWIRPTAGTPTNWANLNGMLVEACASTSTRGLALGSNTLAGGNGNPASVGTTLPDYGRDVLATACCANAGQFIGRVITDTSACNEHRGVSVTPQTGIQIGIRGDIAAPPPVAINLGAISDTQPATNSTLNPSTTKWYTFTLNGDATDDSLQFLDADSEGSAANVAMGLFDSVGTLIGSDDNSGSGTNAQLSFGIGRRAAVGDGLQYDGRNGELVAGTYYIAVAPAGSTFGSGFTSNASANAGGAFTLNLRTNTNGTPLAPSVAPLINGVDYDALLGAPVDPNFPGGDFRQPTPHDTGTRGVVWNRFTLASPIDAAHCLSLDYGTLSTPSADGVAYIFDSSGNIRFFSDDEGPGLLPGFMIGSCGDPAGLPAGTYYLAEALFPADDISFLPTDHRWHVRGTSGSNLTLAAILTASGSGGTTCDPDFNQDGNADQGDVDYLLNVVAGGENPTAIDPDFNHDGNVDQSDIDALLNVVAGGPCP
ncbi:MAG: hypothetical protein WC718_13600 [Phycisphaerales bacterium]|jgi:hypothetical protein